MDLFDSSDGLDEADDWERSQFQNKTKAGKRQAEAIIAAQAEDRTLSKRNCRRLTYSSGAPGTQSMHARVERTWDAFYTSIKADTATCPTGDDIFRYIDTISRHVKTPIAGKPGASLSTMQGIWNTLINVLTFRHRELKDHYGSHDVLRIKVHLDQLVKRDLLFKGKWYKRQWVGFLVLQKLAATTWLETNVAEGCLSWDRALLKLLAIVLQSALAARSGDVARTQDYQGMACLCYKDVELTLAPQQLGVQHLRGKFTMRYSKAKKDLVNDDLVVFINPLEDRSHNAVCVIKVLLIVALRLGMVYGTTIREVLQHAAARHDRMVQWKHPERPVLCQMRKRSGPLALDKPLPAVQLTAFLRQVALVAGVLDRVSSHAVRRGAIRDSAHLKEAVAGVATTTLTFHLQTRLPLRSLE